MKNTLEPLVNELHELDRELVKIDGQTIKPSQCYHFETDPLHLLFNTNCPDSLKERINGIVKKYIPDYEGGAFE